MTLSRLSALLAVCALTGCMAPVAAPAPQVPAAPPVPVPVAPRVVAPVAPTAPPVAAPAAPAAPSGPVDGRTGLHQASLISVTGDADSRFTVLFRPAQTDAAKIDAAPAQLCRGAGRGLEDSRTNKPGAGSAMPGVQMMIVTCSAA
ncbi:hypothetical protein GIY56_02470 [Paracoccus sp. YIM 132242]|uniref:Uncharacterized protein n=1 Tax=Paracoccus lichenicola TaxID=2665644 RepID=A0A6L6HPB2_9RHOB|nr:hypothetical protein [Paracoccus lichenicola]MTD99147.1 hypothetical protein [Paracoccus lichenicola]